MKALPQPPFVAVVESPANSQYTGRSARLESAAGKANAAGRRLRRVKRMMPNARVFLWMRLE
jgi:hypothetical protein